MGAESEGDEVLSSYKLQDLLDNFQISLISVKPGSRLPGGMRAEELPTQLFDMENGYFDVDKTLAALQAAASAQGKTELAFNLSLIINGKRWFESDEYESF